MTTIFVISPKGFNIGNHAIHLGMQHFLREAFGEVINLISIPASSRYEVHQRTGLTKSTVHEINQFGDGVIVGGGNLYENGELDLDPHALEALEVPLMLFSLSAGRIYNRGHKLVRRTDAMADDRVRALNKKSAISLARDKHTLAYLHQVGADHAELGGCPTIFLNLISQRIPTIPESDRSGALVSVRNPSLMNIPLPLQGRVHNDVQRIIKGLRALGYDRIRLFCHDHRDIPFAVSFPEVDFVYTDDIYTYLGLLRNCAINVTYRLHSALPCLSFGRPFIKISYDERSTSLMDTVGMDEWNINMIDEPDLWEEIAKKHDDIDNLPRLREAAKPVWDSLRGTMSNAFARFASQVADQRGLRNG